MLFLMSARVNIDQYMELVALHFKVRQAEGAQNITSDAHMLDASQGTFNTELFVDAMQRFGMPVEVARRIVDSISKAVLTNEFLNVTVEESFFSGLFWTYLYNTYNCAALSTFVWDWDGFCTMAGAGDDDTWMANNPRINAARAELYRIFVRTKFTYTVDDSSDYCGLITADGEFLPHLFRFFTKLVAYRTNKWTDFVEYQLCMRDNIQRIIRAGLDKVLAAMILNRITDTPNGRSQMSVAEAEAIWNTYCSWAYAKKADYEKYFKTYTFEDQTLNAENLYTAGGVCSETHWGVKQV